MRYALILALTLAAAYCVAFGQESTSTNPGPATASCNFTDQQQLAVQYQKLEFGKKEKDFLGHQVPYGKVWEPGKEPLTLVHEFAGEYCRGQRSGWRIHHVSHP